MKKENQYNVTDLSRAIIREFLIQKGMKSTLETYEKEDKFNIKKISKALLVDMLSIKNLCILNKQQLNPQNTLLQILVAYLNKKYQIKKNGFVKTEPQLGFQNMADISKRQFLAKQQTVQLVPKQNKVKERPSTSKNRSKPAFEEVLKPAQTLEKEQLKNLYKKVIKKEEGPIQKQGVVEKKEDKILKLKKQQNIQQKSHSKTVAAIPNVNQIIVEEEYQQPFEAIQNQPKQNLERSASFPNIVKEQKLEDNLPLLKDQLMSLPPSSLHKLQGALNSISVPKKQENLETKTQFKKQIQPLSSQNRRVQQYNNSQKGDKIKAHTTLQNIIRQVSNRQTPIPLNENRIKQLQKCEIIQKQASLSHQLSQQKINPLPIVHFIQTQPLEQQSLQSKLQKFKTHNFQFKMGSSQTKQQTPPQICQIAQQVASIKQQQPKKTELKFQKPQKTQEINPIPTLQVVKQQEQVKLYSQQIKMSQKKQISLSSQNEKPIVQIKQQAGPVMMTLGKKKKPKEQSNDSNYPTKFKFDENFTLEIPKEITYDYEPFNIDKITLQQNLKQKYPSLILQSGINYKQKGGGVIPQKKKQQKLITSKQAEKLKQITFQQGPSILPKAWSQGFILSPFQTTPFGLKQIQGGPCGIIAAVQCYFLKHLLFSAKEINFQDPIVRETALIAAITDMLWKVKSTDKIILAFSPKGASKIDVNNLRINMIDANDFPSAFAGVWANRQQYLGEKNFGVAALLFTAILTKGIDKIEQQIDIKTNPLIGNHGHCTQQFVNLLLTGKAISNCFDGDKVIDDYKIKGVTERAQFGFLTIFETLKFIQVGKNLKNPVFPVWIICKEFHYHVIFGGHYLISQGSKLSKFDIVYFDGLYNCGDRIRLTLEGVNGEQQQEIKIKDLPLIEQVMMTKWGYKKVNWNGSIKIL